MKTVVFIITVLLNALSAGFFFAWSVSVILGTKKVGDFTYLETMQNVNREILNPVFFIVFFGSLITLVFNSILQYDQKPVFGLVLAAAIIYLIGTFGVTAFGNVPLNDALNVTDISSLGVEELKQFRTHYEHHWNRYHNIRTVAGLLSFFLLILSLFIQKLY